MKPTERSLILSAPEARAAAAMQPGECMTVERAMKLPRWSTGRWVDLDEDETGPIIICTSTGCYASLPSPLGAPGTRVWGRETWRASDMLDKMEPRDLFHGDGIHYEADGTRGGKRCITIPGRKRSASTLPRWAARLFFTHVGSSVAQVGGVWMWRHEIRKEANGV